MKEYGEPQRRRDAKDAQRMRKGKTDVLVVTQASAVPFASLRWGRESNLHYS